MSVSLSELREMIRDLDPSAVADLEAAVTALEGEVTALDGRITAIETVTPALIRAAGSSSASTNMSTTEQAKLTVPLLIPSEWAGWAVEVWGKVDWIDNGAAGASQVLTVRPKLDGTLLGTGTVVEVEIGATRDVGSVYCHGTAAGLTVTGSRSVTLTTQLGGDNLGYNSRNLELSAHAWRTG